MSIKKQKVIHVDVDGVLRNIHQELYDKFISVYPKEREVLLEPKNWTFWEIWKYFDMSEREFKKLWFDKWAHDIYLNAPEMPMARLGLRKLKASGYHVCIVTAQPNFLTKTLTLEWLRRHNMPYDSILFTLDKTIMSPDAVIEDSLLQVHAIIESAARKKAKPPEIILIARPWNAGCRYHIKRVADVEVAATILSSIFGRS